MARRLDRLYREKELDGINPILLDKTYTIHADIIELFGLLEMEQFEIVRTPTLTTGGIFIITRSNKRHMNKQDSERSNKRQRYCIFITLVYFNSFLTKIKIAEAVSQ